MKLKDETLLKQYIAGNDEAYEKLWKRHAQNLMGQAIKFFRNKPELAEEALQDTALTLYEKANQFDGRSKLSSWLYRVMHNHCLI